MNLLSLKTALEYFEQNKDGDNIEAGVNDKGNAKKTIEETVIDIIDVIDSGDGCPVCGKSNKHSQIVKIRDRNGNIQNITAIVCGCGEKYLTRKLKAKLPSSIPWRQMNVLAASQQSSSKKNKKIVVNLSSKHSKKPSSNDIITRCSSCGMPNKLFADKGVCWSCYKEIMSSRFD